MNLNTDNVLVLSYLISSVTFIFGLKMMGNPKTARNGNLLAALGMLLAIAATIALYDDHEGHTARQGIKLSIIAAGLALGAAIGWVTAKRVKMTAMPELVSLFNGMGGACAALIGLMEFGHHIGHYADTGTILAGTIIGSVSFSGSIVAFLKLRGIMQKPLRLPMYNVIDNVALLAVLTIGLVALFTSGAPGSTMLYLTFAMALMYGVLFVVPIGGADMPVVISLLNSFTGLAVAFSGFLYHNQVMLTGGILVGSAGTILTVAMCRAMNRPLGNVIFGAFGEGSAAAIAGVKVQGAIRDISVSDAAILMNYSKKVIIVPGYGLAVAQAQHTIHDLETLLKERGVEVKYAIHPVAGRMPGHMNVLLAEAEVDYGDLLEMDDANGEFPTTDVALIVGANDVVNPAAKNDPSSPIYGMPILDAENARHLIIVKRSMKTGYAGIDNELFYNPKTSMLFGDAKKVITSLINELKNM